jgi:5-carboxymethyl-2-hydroxymuconate isomerase
MPHLVILYTPNLERELEWDATCRSLCDTMLAVRDENGAQVYPTGGTRVFAIPAGHYAVADGSHDAAFVYFNIRMAKGRSEATRRAAGEAVTAAVKTLFAPLLARRAVGLTVQIDEGHEVFDAKVGNLHALYAKP